MKYLTLLLFALLFSQCSVTLKETDDVVKWLDGKTFKTSGNSDYVRLFRNGSLSKPLAEFSFTFKGNKIIYGSCLELDYSIEKLNGKNRVTEDEYYFVIQFFPCEFYGDDIKMFVLKNGDQMWLESKVFDGLQEDVRSREYILGPSVRVE